MSTDSKGTDGDRPIRLSSVFDSGYLITGEIERKARVRLVDAARKPLPTTAFGWQRF